LTHIRVPPFAQVSIDAARVGVPADDGVWIVDVGSGADAKPRLVALEHRAIVVALATGRRGIAAWGDGRLSVITTDAHDATVARTNTTAQEQPVRRLAFAEGQIVATEQTAGGLRLRAWNVDDLSTQTEGAVWTGAEDDGLLAAGRGVLVWGRTGDDLDVTDGTPFVKLCELGENIAETWNGADLDIRPNGFVFPLLQGAIGAYDRHSLAEIRPAPDGWSVISRRAWDGAAQAASSPRGMQVVSLTSVGDEDAEVVSISVTRMTDGVTIARARTDPFSGPVAVAVDDDGRVVAASVGSDRMLSVVDLAGDSLHRATIRLD
jgi:hypothetical protein